MNKKYKFYYHFNKPASRKANKPLITLHWRGTCYIVNGLWVNVNTRSKFNKRQPHFVMEGWANEITVDDFGASIN